MITFFAILGVLFVLIVLISNIDKFKGISKKLLREDKLINKFNKLVNSITERNIDTVKQELLEVLDEYQALKTEHFQKTNAELSKAINRIEEQILSINTSINGFNRKALEIKAYNGDPKEGAMFLYQVDRFTEVKNKLSDKMRDLTNKKSKLIETTSMFNSNIALKRAEISIMIADSTGIDSGSNIDLKLDKLVIEFKDKVAEQEAYKEINDTIHSKNESIEFDQEAYIEKFNKLT